jgi:hypothetical protein
MLKKCCTCKIEFPVEMFCKNRSTNDGLHRNCRQCKSKQARRERNRHKDRIAKTDKKYQMENRERLTIQKHEYYMNNKEEIKKRIDDYISKNRDKHNKWGTKSKNKLKLETFSRYCGGDVKCSNCGEKDYQILSIDHIEGNGNQHRKETKTRGGYSTYSWLKRNDYPGGFQVLCMNCQFRTRYKLPEHPTKGQLQRSNYRKLVKSQCLANYGKICPCGESDFDVLTLDHVNDDGARHRLNIGVRGFNFYIYLRSNEFPNEPSLQVLCMNCQYRKRCGTLDDYLSSL